MESMLMNKIKKAIDKDVEKDFEKDDKGDKHEESEEREVEADINQDLVKDVDKDVDKAFGHDMKKDMESQLNSHIPERAQTVEKTDEHGQKVEKMDIKRSTKIVATINGCCTWANTCDTTKAFCSLNEGSCKRCGGWWKNYTLPRDFFPKGLDKAGLDKAWCAKGKMDNWALPAVAAYRPVSRASFSVKILDWNLE